MSFFGGTPSARPVIGFVPDVFVAFQIGARRMVHLNLSEGRTADWSLEQLPQLFFISRSSR